MFRSLALAGAVALVAFAPAKAEDVSGISLAIETAMKAGIAEDIAKMEAVTVFVPENETIDGLPGDALNPILADQEKLKGLISSYALPGKVMSTDVARLLGESDGEVKVKTLAGGDFSIKKEGEDIMVMGAQGSAKIVQPDVTMGNVVIHIVEGAFLPTS